MLLRLAAINFIHLLWRHFIERHRGLVHGWTVMQPFNHSKEYLKYTQSQLAPSCHLVLEYFVALTIAFNKCLPSCKSKMKEFLTWTSEQTSLVGVSRITCNLFFKHVYFLNDFVHQWNQILRRLKLSYNYIEFDWSR